MAEVLAVLRGGGDGNNDHDTKPTTHPPQHHCVSGSCLTFGEIALVEQDCIRTASVVANTHLDLLVIDRALFNRCLHGVVAEDMKVRESLTSVSTAWLLKT